MANTNLSVVLVPDPAKSHEALEAAVHMILELPEGPETQRQIDVCRELVKLKKVLRERPLNYTFEDHGK